MPCQPSISWLNSRTGENLPTTWHESMVLNENAVQYIFGRTVILFRYRLRVPSKLLTSREPARQIGNPKSLQEIASSLFASERPGGIFSGSIHDCHSEHVDATCVPTFFIVLYSRPASGDWARPGVSAA